MTSVGFELHNKTAVSQRFYLLSETAFYAKIRKKDAF